MALHDRLLLALREKQMKAAHLAKACDVSRATVSDWLSGKTKEISGRSLILATKALQVEPLWLLNGRGPMRPEPSIDPGPALTPRQRALLDLYESLTDDQASTRPPPLAEAATDARRESRGPPLASIGKRGALPPQPPLAEPNIDPEALRLAEAIQRLPPDTRAHLQAVTRAFTESQPWDGKLERRKEGEKR